MERRRRGVQGGGSLRRYDSYRNLGHLPPNAISGLTIEEQAQVEDVLRRNDSLLQQESVRIRKLRCKSLQNLSALFPTSEIDFGDVTDVRNSSNAPILSSTFNAGSQTNLNGIEEQGVNQLQSVRRRSINITLESHNSDLLHSSPLDASITGSSSSIDRTALSHQVQSQEPIKVVRCFWCVGTITATTSPCSVCKKSTACSKCLRHVKKSQSLMCPPCYDEMLFEAQSGEWFNRIQQNKTDTISFKSTPIQQDNTDVIPFKSRPVQRDLSCSAADLQESTNPKMFGKIGDLLKPSKKSEGSCSTLDKVDVTDAQDTSLDNDENEKHEDVHSMPEVSMLSQKISVEQNFAELYKNNYLCRTRSLSQSSDVDDVIYPSQQTLVSKSNLSYKSKCSTEVSINPVLESINFTSKSSDPNQVSMPLYSEHSTLLSSPHVDNVLTDLNESDKEIKASRQSSHCEYPDSMLKEMNNNDLLSTGLTTQCILSAQPVLNESTSIWGIPENEALVCPNLAPDFSDSASLDSSGSSEATDMPRKPTGERWINRSIDFDLDKVGHRHSYHQREVSLEPKSRLTVSHTCVVQEALCQVSTPQEASTGYYGSSLSVAPSSSGTTANKPWSCFKRKKHHDKTIPSPIVSCATGSTITPPTPYKNSYMCTDTSQPKSFNNDHIPNDHISMVGSEIVNLVLTDIAARENIVFVEPNGAKTDGNTVSDHDSHIHLELSEITPKGSGQMSPRRMTAVRFCKTISPSHKPLAASCPNLDSSSAIDEDMHRFSYKNKSKLVDTSRERLSASFCETPSFNSSVTDAAPDKFVKICYSKPRTDSPTTFGKHITRVAKNISRDQFIGKSEAEDKYISYNNSAFDTLATSTCTSALVAAQPKMVTSDNDVDITSSSYQNHLLSDAGTNSSTGNEAKDEPDVQDEDEAAAKEYSKMLDILDRMKSDNERLLGSITSYDDTEDRDFMKSSCSSLHLIHQEDEDIFESDQFEPIEHTYQRSEQNKGSSSSAAELQKFDDFDTSDFSMDYTSKYSPKKDSSVQIEKSLRQNDCAGTAVQYSSSSDVYCPGSSNLFSNKKVHQSMSKVDQDKIPENSTKKSFSLSDQIEKSHQLLLDIDRSLSLSSSHADDEDNAASIYEWEEDEEDNVINDNIDLWEEEPQFGNRSSIPIDIKAAKRDYWGMGATSCIDASDVGVDSPMLFCKNDHLSPTNPDRYLFLHNPQHRFAEINTAEIRYPDYSPADSEFVDDYVDENCTAYLTPALNRFPSEGESGWSRRRFSTIAEEPSDYCDSSVAGDDATHYSDVWTDNEDVDSLSGDKSRSNTPVETTIEIEDTVIKATYVARISCDDDVSSTVSSLEDSSSDVEDPKFDKTIPSIPPHRSSNDSNSSSFLLDNGHKSTGDIVDKNDEIAQSLASLSGTSTDINSNHMANFTSPNLIKTSKSPTFPYSSPLNVVQSSMTNGVLPPKVTNLPQPLFSQSEPAKSCPKSTRTKTANLLLNEDDKRQLAADMVATLKSKLGHNYK